jgi:uncharacterized protein
MLSGLEFKSTRPVLPSLPQRADVACFIGFIHRRPLTAASTLPAALQDWFTTRGWVMGTYRRSPDDRLTLRDIPVPIHSWAEFTTLFNPVARDWTGQGGYGSTYLATAVRSFFAAGGHKCYVVRVADPPLPSDNPIVQDEALAQLLPGYPGAITSSAVDPVSWRGIGHLFGLDDVSFVALPDLPSLVQSALPLPKPPLPPPPALAEQFVECSQPQGQPTEFNLRQVPVPRCDAAGYDRWAAVVHRVGDFLAMRRAGQGGLRELQFVAAVPLPMVGSAAEEDLWRSLNPYLSHRLTQDPLGIASAFVQLGYPWLQTDLSHRLPAQVEPPDGWLVGTLAYSALTRGTFRSAVNQPLPGVEQVVPVLGRSQLYNLLDRVSLIGPTPQGLRLLSDVTTSLDPAYRPACLNRLMAAMVRMARQTGEETVFEASNEALWARLRSHLESLLMGFWTVGALRGTTPAEAFEVRCDRTTTSQADIDNGRAIVQVTVAPAQPITRITVLLTVTQSGVERLPAALPSVQEDVSP